MKNVDVKDMTTISAHLKKRFCKDCSIPIAIYDEPYFSHRLKLLNPYYLTLPKWKRFTDEFEKFEREEDYFTYYNSIKDAAISDIKESEGYKNLLQLDMSQFTISPEYRKFPTRDIFHPDNVGRKFISIDMKKANFSSLHLFDPGIFKNCETWEEFISQYTDSKHIVNSKYIRQVILGNCSCKRHITYEKYLMGSILSIILEKYAKEDSIAFFSNDEIILDITDWSDLKIDTMNLNFLLDEHIESTNIPVDIEAFILRSLSTANGYYKEFDDEHIEFKCVDSISIPFAIREVRGEEIDEFDRIFNYHGTLAKFIKTPSKENA